MRLVLRYKRRQAYFSTAHSVPQGILLPPAVEITKPYCKTIAQQMLLGVDAVESTQPGMAAACCSSLLLIVALLLYLGHATDGTTPSS